MNRKQKEILKKVIQHKETLIARNVFNDIVSNDIISANILIASKYIDETPVHIGEAIHTAYRVSEKGYMAFEPFHKKILYAIKGDIKTIIIAIVVAVVTTIITILTTNIMK